MKRYRWIYPIIIIAWALGASLAVFGDVQPLRAPISLSFLLICPGLAWVRLLGLQEVVAEWTLAVVLSLALDTIVAETMLYAGAWSPDRSLAVLASLSVAGALAQIIAAAGARRPLEVNR
jgi:type II secretory pathway component PulF